MDCRRSDGSWPARVPAMALRPDCGLNTPTAVLNSVRRPVGSAIAVFILLFSLNLPGQNAAAPGGFPANGSKSATLLGTRSDKRVVQTGRWYVVRQFTVDFAVQDSSQTYCGELVTTVVNEVDDLQASQGQPVKLLQSGKDIDVTLQNGRRIRAYQVPANRCQQK